MAPKMRNLTVGLVVIGAMVVLGWMIFRFGAEPAKMFRPPQIDISFTADRADGLGEGSNIHFLGVEVGRVVTVSRDPQTNKISITAEVNKKENLPSNMSADIVMASPLGGVASLELKISPTGAEASKTPLKNGDVLQARYLGSTFLPPEFADLARNANETIRQFNDAKLVDKIKETVELTQKRIDQTGKVIEGASTLINDPKLREDLTTTMASLRATAESARQFTDHINSLTGRIDAIADKAEKAVDSAHATFDTTNKKVDELGTQIGQQLVKVSHLLDNVNDISAKINAGTGTAGQLVNDPKLYQALVDATKELNGGLADFRRLVQQWEQEGVTLKLGK